MYPIPPSEHLVENRVCRKCQANFPITDKDMEFYEKVSPVFSVNPLGKEGGSLEGNGSETGDFFSEETEQNPQSPRTSSKAPLPRSFRYLIPPPTLCPDCRQQRRLSFRNERKLYKRKCDATGKEIVSIYSPDKPYTVYHQDYWWSDAWDPMSYGREFDFTRSAMEQMGELTNKVPKISLFLNRDGSENSEYTNHSGTLKNCYFCFGSWEDVDCLYCSMATHSTNCVDSTTITKCENCYFCVNTATSYDCIYCNGCEGCSHLAFCQNCKSCKECFGCSNLQNKQYCLYNVQYTRDEYLQKIGEIRKKDFDFQLTLKNGGIRSHGNLLGCENCFGDNIINSKDCCYAFDIYGNVDQAKYITHGLEARNVYDAYGFGVGTDIGYELVDVGLQSSNHYFSILVHNTSHSYYSTFCFHSLHMFLCTGLRNASYCILNKQYTKEEYEELVPKIIEKMMSDGEWGEFFPASLSPFGYNETVANEYYPLTKAEAISQGFNWSDYEAPFPKVEKIIPASRLPEDITEIPDDILNWAIKCEVSGKPFRIIKQELEFYRKHHLPIPRRHPDQRHLDRMKMRNPRKLYERLCDCEKCEYNNKTSLLSSSVGGSLGKERDSRSENDKDMNLLDSYAFNPKTGTRTKRMITTYPPERPEIVYCEECYEREVLS